MTLLFIVFISIYGAFVLFLLVGWERTRDQETTLNLSDPFISVVIPFRNEQNNLPGLLLDLKAQRHPNFEVVLIDDHSTDLSRQIVEDAMEGFENARLISLDTSSGKKAALTEGIRQAKANIILTTDADCQFNKDWLSQVARSYDETAKMVIGSVRIKGDRFFGKLQSIEMASLTGTSGGTLGWGFPSMCNGANLSFKKSAFEEVGGYETNESIPSGDDDFLMRKFFDRYPLGIRFLTHRDSVVATHAQTTISAFVQQRLRWAGKWRHNSSASVKLLALSVLSFHLSLIAFSGLAAAGYISSKVFFYGMGARFFVEALFLFSVCRFLQVRWSWFAFLVLQFFYPVYVVSIGFASQWMSAEWKGRKVTPRV
jgi:poly-beta-1,6-N-acetyl-D-glucosamine synthase